MAPGSVSRTLPIPGLREQGIGFKTIGEAIYLRNHVLDRLDVAAVTPDPEVRKASLTFVFVGGGYAGIEALAEMEDMVRDALRYYPELEPKRHALGAGRGDQPDPARGRAGHGRLHGAASCRPRHRHPAGAPGWSPASTAWSSSPTATAFRADTIVWTAGVKPSPMLDRTDLPRDPRGHVTCLPTLQVVDGDRVLEGAWSAGDCAAVPDLTKPPGALLLAERPARGAPGRPCWPTTSRR